MAEQRTGRHLKSKTRTKRRTKPHRTEASREGTPFGSAPTGVPSVDWEHIARVAVRQRDDAIRDLNRFVNAERSMQIARHAMDTVDQLLQRLTALRAQVLTDRGE